MSLNVAQPGSVWAWNCSPLSKLRAFTSLVTWMPACTRRHYISWDWCVCLCACVWYELRILAGRYLSLNRKWPPTFKSCHKIKQCFIYARYLCLLTALPFWIHLHHKFLQWNLNCGCSAILCDLNVLFINNSQNKPLLYMYWVCVPLFFLSFVEIPCVFSFGVAVGLRNSICIFLERFCNLVTNRKSGRVQCLIDVGRWKVRSMAVRVVSSLGRMIGGGMRDGEYFCCYRRKCKWYDKSATTPKISFFKEKNADFWALGVEFQLFQKLAIMAAVCGGILLHHIIWVQPVNLFQSTQVLPPFKLLSHVYWGLFQEWLTLV